MTGVEGWDTLKARGWIETASGCWEYAGYRSPNGYGRIVTSEGRIGAHRVAFRQHHGTIPEGHLVRHKCDNPPCVNPDHLESGTPKQNMQDRDERGHGPQGEGNGFSKLNGKLVSQIRDRHGRGERTSSIARDLGVHYTTVRRVTNGETWRADS